MSNRLPVTPAPGLLEAYAQAFDPLFSKRNQRETFRRYLEGLLLSSGRNKTLTALANTEPVVDSVHPQAQKLQWFLSESTWDPAAVNARRLLLLQQTVSTAATPRGVLVIDETGDRKWGSKTAHVGRQYLGSIGKTDNGVVSVHSLWADEQRYYPIEFEPYTPAHWFERKDKDPKFRTKPKIARILVKQAQAANIPFRAVVADSFYGEHDAFRDGLQNDGIPFVLALYPSHTWWHKVGAIGSAQEIAQAASWREDDPGKWQRLERTFRDRHKEIWWVLEGEAGPYGVNKPQRLIIATMDPEQLPNLTTWYLTTNLPAPDSQNTEEGEIEAANAEDIVKLYGLRIWVEQSYKQVKQHLGWAEYQVRSDLAMRRHWQLVCCAFSFCWWEQTYAPETTDTQAPENEPTSNAAGGDPQPDKKKPCCTAAVAELARSVEKGSGVSRTLPHALALLARVVAEAPAA